MLEIDQQEVQALLELLELGNEEICEGMFSDALIFLDEIDDPDSRES